MFVSGDFGLSVLWVKLSSYVGKDDFTKTGQPEPTLKAGHYFVVKSGRFIQ